MPKRHPFVALGLRWLEWLRTPRGLSTAFWGLVWVGFTVLYLVPLLGNRYVPSQDMGDHLALVNIWRSMSSSPIMHAEYMPRPGFQPYILHYALLRGLGYFFSLETANRIVLALYVVALPASLLYLFRRFGKDGRYALLTFPFIYNTYFIYGFLSNLMALPILFTLLGLLKSYLDRPSWRRELGLVLLLLLLASTHILVLASFAVAGPVIFFAHVRRPIEVLRKSLFVWPAAVLSLVWVMGRNVSGKGLKGSWLALDKTMRLFLTWLNDIFRDNDDEKVLLAVVFTVGLALLLPCDDDSKRVRASWSLPAAGLALALAYFLAPTNMAHPSHWATGPRLVLPAFLLLLALPQAKLKGWRQLILVPGLVMVAWGGYRTYDHFARFDRIARDLDHVLSFVPPNQRVLPLVYDEDDGIHQAHVLRSILLLYQARKGGYMPEGFTQIKDGFTPVLKRHRKIAPPWRHPRMFRYSLYGKHYDYFLVVLPRRGPKRIWPTFPGAEGHVRLLAQRGRFAAYDNLDH